MVLQRQLQWQAVPIEHLQTQLFQMQGEEAGTAISLSPEGFPPHLAGRQLAAPEAAPLLVVHVPLLFLLQDPTQVRPSFIPDSLLPVQTQCVFSRALKWVVEGLWQGWGPGREGESVSADTHKSLIQLSAIHANA
jgi:hypothetical protein